MPNRSAQPAHQMTKPAAEATELDIIRKAAAGDGDAFEVLMRRYNQALFRTARSILKNDADAEDAVQEAYLQAWRALDKFRADSKLSTWLVRITANVALGRLRKFSPQTMTLETAMISTDPKTQLALSDKANDGPEAKALLADLRKQIEEQIDRLPEAFRTVFVLRAVEEMDIADVAATLDIPEATVRSRYFRAKNLLSESLGPEAEGHLTTAFGFDGERCDRIVANVLSKARTEGLCK